MQNAELGIERRSHKPRCWVKAQFAGISWNVPVKSDQQIVGMKNAKQMVAACLICLVRLALLTERDDTRI